MIRWIKKFERAFVAITFAKMGEHHIAIKMSGIRSWKKRDCLTLWDEIFTTVCWGRISSAYLLTGGQDLVILPSLLGKPWE